MSGDTRTHLVCEDSQRPGVLRVLHEAGVPFVEAGWTSYWASDIRVKQRTADMRVVALSDPGGTPSDYSTAIARGEPYRNPKHRAFLARIARPEPIRNATTELETKD